MFAFLQVLCVIVLLAGIIIFFGNIKKKPVSVVAGLCVLLIVSAEVSAAVLKCIPMATEQITLTATGEKNENAKSNEVALSAIIADGKTYEINNAIEGKWFWQGDNYMWRNENDTRQPKGTTRSVTIDIPVGAGRKLVFNNNQYRGIVEIIYNGETTVHDLYRKSNESTKISIPSTDSLYDNMVKIGRLALFALFIVILISYPVFAVYKFDYKIIKKWFARNWDRLYFIAIAFLYVFLVQKKSVDGSLWCDELYQISWTYTGAWPKEQISLFSLISDVWFKIMPYGQENLRLLSQFLVAGTIFFAGLIGSEFKSKRLGVILSSVVACSVSVIYQCSMCIRSYAMILFSSTLMIYFFLKNHNKMSDPHVKDLFFYGAVIAFAMDAHMMNVMVAGFLMVADFLMIVLKKASKKCLFEFVLPAFYGIYWLFNIIPTFLGNTLNYTGWVGKLSISRIWDFIQWVFSYNDILIFAAICGFVLIIVNLIFKIFEKKFDIHKDYTILTISAIPLLQVAIIAFYSFKVNPQNSMFIDRYFVSSFICMFFVLSYGIDAIILLVCRLTSSRVIPKAAVLVIICTMSLYGWSQIAPWNPWPRSYRTNNHDFKSAADYVMRQNDCYCSSTIFVVDHTLGGNVGIKYYTTHKGERDNINHISISSIKKDISEYQVIYISYVWHGDRQNSMLNSIIDEQYELVSNDQNAKVKKYVRKN